MSIETDTTLEASEENYFEEYKDLLSTYHRYTSKLQALIKNDPQDLEEIKEYDRQRHETHLTLNSVGAKIGRTEQDVLIDIIRYKRSLEDYQLPEFSILIPEDLLIEFDPYESRSYLNINFSVNENKAGRFPDLDIGKITDRQDLVSDEDLDEDLDVEEDLDNEDLSSDGDIEEPKLSIPSDSFLLVYSVDRIHFDREEYSPDFTVKEKRMKKLLEQEELGGKFYTDQNSNFHDASVSITGIIFKKSQFDNVIGFLRRHPELRISPDFYTAEEVEQIQRNRLFQNLEKMNELMNTQIPEDPENNTYRFDNLTLMEGVSFPDTMVNAHFPELETARKVEFPNKAKDISLPNVLVLEAVSFPWELENLYIGGKIEEIGNTVSLPQIVAFITLYIKSANSLVFPNKVGKDASFSYLKKVSDCIITMEVKGNLNLGELTDIPESNTVELTVEGDLHLDSLNELKPHIKIIRVGGDLYLDSLTRVSPDVKLPPTKGNIYLGRCTSLEIDSLPKEYTHQEVLDKNGAIFVPRSMPFEMVDKIRHFLTTNPIGKKILYDQRILDRRRR